MSNVTHQSNAASAPAFAHLKFPPYEFREYPKMIKDTAGRDVIVHDAREELAVLKVSQDADLGVSDTADEGDVQEDAAAETVEVEVPRGRRGRRQG